MKKWEITPIAVFIGAALIMFCILLGIYYGKESIKIEDQGIIDLQQEETQEE